MRLKTRKYDAANYLDSDDMIAVYLESAFETGNASFIAEALGDVARAVMNRTRRQRPKTRTRARSATRPRNSSGAD